jgi:hypothetical protein
MAFVPVVFAGTLPAGDRRAQAQWLRSSIENKGSLQQQSRIGTDEGMQSGSAVLLHALLVISTLAASDTLLLLFLLLLPPFELWASTLS